jgi:nickel/cobalt transporter (NicO) family protein
MSVMLPYTTALLLGSLHALEADHMAAVTSFAVRRPGLREAARFGVRWAAGHGGAIIVVGALLLVVGTQLPDTTEQLLERLVGVVMIGLGIWTFRGAARMHAHGHAGAAHADVAANDAGRAPWAQAAAGRAPGAQAAATGDARHTHALPVHKHGGHPHAVTAVGVVHGLAGSGAAVALVPVVALNNPMAGIGYLAVFALGTILAMALYGVVAGFIVGRASHVSMRLTRIIARLTGIMTVIVGTVWLVR